MNEMTDEQKKECRDNWYTRDRNSYFEACDGNCAICTLSYDYVTGFYEGYQTGYDDAY